MKNLLRITIDGPAASGKSTVAEILAKKLDLILIDSGMLYRAVTFLFLTHLNKTEGFFLKDSDLTENKVFFENLELQLKDKEIYFENKKIPSASLRSSWIDNNVKIVAKHLFVRERVRKLQRELALRNSLVMVGRDIGTVILPNADIKFFVTCSAEERAKRRWKQNPSADKTVLLKEIIKRDEEDSNREHSPLKAAIDSITIDNGKLTLEETANKMIEIVKNKSFN